jgi:hypothetical protein
VSCPTPIGGWPFEKVNQEGLSRVAQYVNTATDGGTPRIDDTQRIMTAPFTGDLERHRQELAAMYDGPVCVEQAKASHTELAELAKTVDAEAKRDGLGVLSTGTGNAFGTVNITVVAATDRQRREMSEAHGGLVEVDSFLKPVP